MLKQFFILVVFFLNFTIFSQVAPFNISLLYHWHDSTIVRTGLHDNAYNEVWGFVQDGIEYGVIGSTRGTHIFNLSNPSAPILVDFIWGRDTGTQIVHRDYHDYKGYLYAVSDEGDASLQIMDLSYLPDSVHVVYDQDTIFKRSHNIFIDTISGKMFSCGGENKFDVLDITNPVQPNLIVRCHTDVAWWPGTVGSSNGGYVHDVYVRNDTAWCNAGDGLYIVDFNNTTSPILLGSITSYPDIGYNHSGWLSDDGKTYALADETHGKKVKILDVSNLSNIQFIDTIGSNIGPNSIPHNLIFRGNYLFVSFYHDGLYVWDLTNPNAPVLVGYYDTSEEPNSLDYRGNWGVYPLLPSGTILASDMQTGFFVFDASIAISSTGEIAPKDRFMVYPNPFNDQINIVGLSGFNEEYTFTVIDKLGKTLFKEVIQSEFLERKTILLDKYPSKSVYFLQISNAKYTQTIPLVKQ